MSATARVGRPAGPDPETLRQGREFLAQINQGATADEIAARTGRSRSQVYRSLAVASDPNLTQGESEHLPPKKMSRRTLLDRAWIVLHIELGFRMISDALQFAWLKAVMAINGYAEDGINLRFGTPGPFHSRLEFATALGRTLADLEEMFERGLLIGLEDGGIAMPEQFGLRRRERIAGRHRANQSGDRKSTRLNSSHITPSRMPSSA